MEEAILNEVTQHLEDRYTELKTAGASEEDAVTGALDELEAMPVLSNQLRALDLSRSTPPTREPRYESALTGFVEDCRKALRSLVRTPGFTALTTIVLALGIGLNISTFTLAARPFLTSRPVPDPQSLVYLYPERSNLRPRLVDFRQATRPVFSHVATLNEQREIISSDLRSMQRDGEAVSANYFDVLGLQPARGRAFLEEDDNPYNMNRSVVISHRLWHELLDGADSALGATVHLGDVPYTVIGVMPEGFAGLSAPWHPVSFWVTRPQLFGQKITPQIAELLEQVGSTLVARTQTGVSVRQARAAVTVVAGGNNTPSVRVEAANDIFVASRPDDGQQSVLVMLGTVVLFGVAVMVLVVTNVSGLVAARSISRASQVAIRYAMGAGSGRLVREIVIETSILSALATGLGLLVAVALLRVYTAFPPSAIAIDSTIDLTTGLFALGLAVGVGVILAVVPARQVLGHRSLETLSRAHTTLTRRQRRRLSHGVLVPQIVISTALVCAGTAYISNVLSMGAPTLGYRTEGVALLRIETPYVEASTEETRAVQQDVLRSIVQRLSGVAGVEAAAVSTKGPSDHSARVFTRFVDQAGGMESQGIGAEWGGVVSDAYFSLLEIPLVAGRLFTSQDGPTTPAVAVVTESFVARLWPDGDWRGRRISLATGAPRWLEVVGVVRDTQGPLTSGRSFPRVYTFIGQRENLLGLPLVATVAFRGEPAKQLAALTTAVSLDPRLKALDARTLSAEIERKRYPIRATAWLLSTTGVAGALLVGIGLFGVLSFTVAQRRHELGIRAALGGTPRQLSWTATSMALRLAGCAVVAGLFAGAGAMRLTAAMVDRAPQSPTSTVLVAAALVITAIVAAAAWLPARQAGATDPLSVLRNS
jgi:putative ABC transport system permease protein